MRVWSRSARLYTGWAGPRRVGNDWGGIQNRERLSLVYADASATHREEQELPPKQVDKGGEEASWEPRCQTTRVEHFPRVSLASSLSNLKAALKAAFGANTKEASMDRCPQSGPHAFAPTGACYSVGGNNSSPSLTPLNTSELVQSPGHHWPASRVNRPRDECWPSVDRGTPLMT